MYLFVFIFLVLLIVFSLRYHWWRIPLSNRYARVLMYHSINEHLDHQHKRNKWRVRPKDFAKQMQWLYENGWQSFTISELISLETIPEKSFVLTFDDGFEDNFTHAFPILRRFGFKATIYLTTARTMNDWENFSAGNFDLLLNNKQIQIMLESGAIEFGSHTQNHINLLRCNESESVREIMDSKEDIERITGKKCEAFAYPYGKYDDKLEAIVKKSGYTSAVIVKRGVYQSDDNRFQIQRIGILGTESFFDFYLRITRIRNKI